MYLSTDRIWRNVEFCFSVENAPLLIMNTEMSYHVSSLMVQQTDTDSNSADNSVSTKIIVTRNVGTEKCNHELKFKN